MKVICCFLLVLLCLAGFAQTDTTNRFPFAGDSVAAAASDSLTDSSRVDSVISTIDSATAAKILHPAFLQKKAGDTLADHPFQVAGLPPLNAPAVFMLSHERVVENKDSLFYLLVGIVFFLAFIKAAFPKYFDSIFKLFLQSSFRQKQTREQIVQNRLASLLFNLLFFTTSALFVTVVLYHKQPVHAEFWPLFFYCMFIIAAIYFGKFLFVSFAGWIFHANEIASTYLFIVFLVNKVVGITLLPLLVFIAYGNEMIVDVVLVVSLCMLCIMLVYRYVVGFSTLMRDLKLNPMHFFIYLCAVEIAPLLVIYKVVSNQIGTSI